MMVSFRFLSVLRLNCLNLVRVFFAVMVFFFCLVSQAKSNLPLISAVQKRPNQLSRELSGHFSYLPLDHFNTYFALGLSYTHWFNDYLGWEVANLNYAKSSPTGLESYLVGTYGANPETFDILQYYGTTNLIYSPLFMKHLFKSESIVWGDLSFVGGVGMARLERNGNIGAFDFGGMVRFFSGAHWIYRLDIRQYLFSSALVKPNMAIAFGVSYNFGKAQVVEPIQEEEE